MRWLFLALLVLHGLIHFMGFAKAFGLADLPQLTQPIPRGMGLAWLAAGLALLTAAALFVWVPKAWWLVGLAAVMASQFVILSSWSDAKFGTIANVLVLLGVVYGFAAEGPFSFRADYRTQVRQRVGPPASLRTVTEADLAALPAPVQRYVRLSGAVGQPQVHHFRAAWRGRIRATADAPWMPFTAEQYNVVDTPARFFLMHATRSGVPVDVYHAFTADTASMRVRLLSLVPLVRAAGPEMHRAETVTFFNDLAILAPGALIDPAIAWEPIDTHTARAFFTVGSDTVSAELSFNDAGELVDFVSDDRLAASPDGTTFAPRRWSTPVRGYRMFGPRRAATGGVGRWHPAEGAFDYIELELLELETNHGWR